METENYISIQQFCVHYNVPITFITALYDYDLIEIIVINETDWIHNTQIKTIEKLIRLHYDLNINIEGIDVIYNLLQQVESLQNEITVLNNKLLFHEGH